MVAVDWGEDEPPGEFTPRGASSDPVHSDHAEDVAEVKAARALGYTPSPEAPLWCFLPAIWPPAARTWVRDERVRQQTRMCSNGTVERLPWSTADYAEIEQSYNDLLIDLGLPTRPPGRIWLLRAPRPYPSLDEVLNDIWEGWQRAGGPAMATRGLVEHTQTVLRDLNF